MVPGRSARLARLTAGGPLASLGAMSMSLLRLASALAALPFSVLAGCGVWASGGTTPAVGSPAPAISLSAQDGATRTLASHRGHPVLVYFYPKDATPGCTREACAFRDAWDRLQATGTVVYGVSTDSVESHRRFRDEHQLPFDLLSDPDGAVAASYGVPVRAGFTARMSFLVDAQGNVARVFPDVDPAVHADEVLAAIADL